MNKPNDKQIEPANVDRREFFATTIRTGLLVAVGAIAAILGLRSRPTGDCRTTDDCRRCLVRSLCTADLKMLSEEDES